MSCALEKDMQKIKASIETVRNKCQMQMSVNMSDINVKYQCEICMPIELIYWIYLIYTFDLILHLSGSKQVGKYASKQVSKWEVSK